MAKNKKSEAPAKDASSGMKPIHYVLIAVGAVLILTLLWGIMTYNGLVRSDENVNAKWGNVQADYQRRIDLIPNLVSTVKASSEFEKSMQVQVVAMRSGVSSAKTPEDLELFGKKIESAINVVFENYPNIKSTENYLSLQDELAGTENRIKLSRTDYNEAVRQFNVKVRVFPSSTIAGMFGFSQKTMFAAQAGAENTPNVGNLFGNTATV